MVLAGSSAGAEAILHTAYWPATRAADGQALLPPDFRYAGVISMAGGLGILGLDRGGIGHSDPTVPRYLRPN